MTVEDRLRAAMRAHDADAPTRLPWPADPAVAHAARHRPPARLLLAAALVAVLVGGGTWLAVTWPHETDRSGPVAPVPPVLTCPRTWAAQPPGRSHDVPAPATVGGRADRLVPDVAPQRALVCSYRGAARTLTGSGVLAGGLGLVAEALTYVPHGADESCPGQTPGFHHDGEDYLIGLTYDDGNVWVSAPGNECDGAGNGTFTTSTNLRADAAAWLAAGRGVRPPDPYVDDPYLARCPPVDGRLGQETTMVPGTPSSLTICVAAGLVVVPVDVPTARVAGVVAAVNGLSAHPRPAGSQPCYSDTTYLLDFRYAVGPAVQVSVVPGPECTPNIDNGALVATAPADMVAQIEQLSGR